MQKNNNIVICLTGTTVENDIFARPATSRKILSRKADLNNHMKKFYSQ